MTERFALIEFFRQWGLAADVVVFGSAVLLAAVVGAFCVDSILGRDDG